MAEFDITTIKRKLLRKYPAFGSTISSVKYQIVGKDHPVRTAGTDGKTIYCNQSYLNTLSEDQQLFVFAHEVCHIALNHIMRSEGKDKRLWNIATDAVINEHLQKDGLPIIEGGVNIKGALKYDAEELYQKLFEKMQQQKQNQQEQQEQQEKTQNEAKQEDVSEKETFKKNNEEKIKRAEEIMNKLSTKRRGVGESSQEVCFDDIGKAGKPVVNWKKLLQKTLEIEDEAWGHKFSDSSNGYAARIEDVEYDEQAETEIILDTSGSVSVELLKSFLRQVKTILKNSAIKVGTFSDDFHGFVKIKKESDIDNLRIRVGGGTNFDAASRAFSKRKDINKICFTDGEDYGNAGIIDKRKDIVWISFENPNFKPDNGKVIFVPASEIQKFKVQDKERVL